MSGICYIFGAGDFVNCVNARDHRPVRLERRPEDYIIAADGGLRHLQLLSVMPDLLLGDFDSLGGMPELPKGACELLRLPREKDETDIGAAIAAGREKGYRHFEIYGALGGARLDHSIGNIQLALGLAKSGCEVRLYGNNILCEFIASGGSRTFAAPQTEAETEMISVFSALPVSNGVTIRGLKYTLQDAVLTMDFPLGISNESLIGEEGFIKVGDGLLVITRQKCYSNNGFNF